MPRTAAGAAAIFAVLTVLGCAASPTGSAANTGGGANFGTPGSGSDATSSLDGAKADVATQADVKADAGAPADAAADLASAEVADAGNEDTAELPDTPEEDSAPVADAVDDVIAKPDVVLADTKTDAKSDAGKDTATDAATALTFGTVFDAVVKKYACNSPYCHAEQIGASATVAYAKVMAWKATGKACQGKVVVVPGDPAGSLLWAKIAPGVATCDEKMPPGGGAGVSAEDAKLVQDWIAAGAKP